VTDQASHTVCCVGSSTAPPTDPNEVATRGAASNNRALSLGTLRVYSYYSYTAAAGHHATAAALTRTRKVDEQRRLREPEATGGAVTSGSAKDILKMMAQPETLYQFLNLNPLEVISVASTYGRVSLAPATFRL
jgi:hypothetical protein